MRFYVDSSDIEEMFSRILAKVWPEFGHACWKGQDGQRKTSQGISPDTFASVQSASSDLQNFGQKIPSVKGATGLLTSATQHC